MSRGRIDAALYKEWFNIDITDEELKEAMSAAMQDIKDEANKGKKNIQKPGKSNKRSSGNRKSSK